MGRLIDEDILIDSIPDLSVFEQEDFGTPDMIRLIENAPTVQAIPKADYETRLKADMVAMLTEILTDFDNQIDPNSTRIDCESIIEQKIQALEGKTDGEK